MAQLHEQSLDLNGEIDKLMGGKFDNDQYFKFNDLFEKALFERSNKNQDKLPGAIILLAAGDGSAIYICTKARPLTLRHVYLGDGWQVPFFSIRGMRSVDILERRHVEDGTRGSRAWYGAELATDEHRQTVKDILHRLLPSLF